MVPTTVSPANTGSGPGSGSEDEVVELKKLVPPGASKQGKGLPILQKIRFIPAPRGTKTGMQIGGGAVKNPASAANPKAAANPAAVSDEKKAPPIETGRR